MSPSLAALVWAVGIGGLFYLDRDKFEKASRALWLPVLWIWINGSRPVSVWLGGGPGPDVASSLLEGSPLDRMVYQALLVLGVFAIVGRSRRVRQLLNANWPIVAFFGFGLMSVTWSDYPYVTSKRWLKAVGELVMVLVVVTDPSPTVALKRVFSRTAFVLLPASVLLIRYFATLGRGYDPWTGAPASIGVTTNKNSLGVITFVLSLGVVWRILGLLSAKGIAHRSRQLLANATVLAFGVVLLTWAHSATSGVCFALGTVIMVATTVRVFRTRPEAVHILVLVMAVATAVALLLGGQEQLTRAVGRTSDLTGRTQIWTAVISAAPNPIVGTGFESFWLGPRLEELRRALGLAFVLNSSHNGYIEVYLNLGAIGIGLLASILASGYRHSVALFRRDPALGSLSLAYILTSAAYSMTEAGFRMLSPTWFFLLLAIIGASGARTGTGREHGRLVSSYAGGTRRRRVPATGRSY